MENNKDNPNTSSTPASDDELRELLKKNLAATEEVLKLVKKIKTYWAWQRAYFVLKLLIIAVPIVLGIIYLPPLLEEVSQQYQQAQEALGEVGEIKDKAGSIDLDLIPEQLKGLIK
jgi:uncharacterized protein Yka (UPF0111/DUF47 family)